MLHNLLAVRVFRISLSYYHTIPRLNIYTTNRVTVVFVLAVAILNRDTHTSCHNIITVQTPPTCWTQTTVPVSICVGAVKTHLSPVPDQLFEGNLNFFIRRGAAERKAKTKVKLCLFVFLCNVANKRTINTF